MLICVQGMGQGFIPYHQQMRKAEAQLLDGEKSASLATIRSIAGDYGFPFWRDALFAAQCAVSNDSARLAAEFLREGIEVGLPIKVVKKDVQLKNGIAREDWNHLKAKAKEFHRSPPLANDSLTDALASLFRTDRRIRRRGLFAVSRAEFHRQDSLNRAQIKRIIFQYGYPHPKLIGNARRVQGGAFILIWHGIASPQEEGFYDEKFRKKLRVELERGNLSPGDYARYEDRAAITHSIYGSMGTHPQLGAQYIQAHAAEIDSARATIGLESLALQKRKSNGAQTKIKYRGK
jgi:hypothetical protein